MSISLDEIAAKQTAYFEAITSVDYHSQRDSGGKIPVTLHWQEMGDKTRYEWKHPKPFMRQNAAYDGKQYQQLDPKNGVLYLSKQPFASRQGLLYSERYFTSPFEWVVPQNIESKNGQVKLSALKEPGAIAKALKSATNVSRTNQYSFPVIQFTVPGDRDDFYKRPYSYRVYLSTEHDYYPVGWDKVDASGNVLYNYHITELGEVKLDAHTILYYPKQVAEGYFDITLKTQDWDGKPDIEIKDITFNSLSDDDFTIDPAVAKGIMDMDTKKFIPVPR